MITSYFYQKKKKKSLRTFIERKEKMSKGKTIEYSGGLPMAEYLFTNRMFTFEDQVEIYLMRSRTNDIPANWGKVDQCETNCGSTLTNDHILTLNILNEVGERGEMNKMFNGSLEKCTMYC